MNERKHGRKYHAKEIVAREATRNRTLEVTIERIVPGGLGMAHAENLTVFVTLTAPGDRVRVRVDRVQNRVAFATLIEIIEPSIQRAAPPCKYFGRCGGCDFQHLTYEAQLAAKTEMVRDCLRRIARINEPPAIEIIASPNALEYRSRARWQYDAVRMRLGYYELASHRVCDVDVCPVLVPPVQEQLTHLRGQLKHDELSSEIVELQVVAGDDAAALASKKYDADFVADDELTRKIGEEIYHFDATCFFQINHELLAPLIDEALKDAHGESALDLYCGIGLFTLPLARRFAHVTGVEVAPVATKFARRNLLAANLNNATIETARVGEWLKDRVGGGGRKMEDSLKVSDVDFHNSSSEKTSQESGFNKQTSSPVFNFVLLDPPRAGAEKETIESLLHLLPPRIVYVSCDPATLARDIRSLSNVYRLASIKAFDMFPQTHHVETVAHLTL
ncbi:MAG: TRAM domain-containing protein [Pyrinomonadaceae bacterium]